MSGETKNPLDQLKIVNQERLRWLERSMQENGTVCFAFDVHGFVLGADEQFHDTNENILDELARYVSEGGVTIAATGFSDRINIYQTLPLRARLERMNVDVQRVPFYLSTRNGALTTIGFTGGVISHYPIPNDMFTEITGDPLVRSLHRLTHPAKETEIQKGYAQLVNTLDFPLHPNADHFPRMRLDWYPVTNAGYQITLGYDTHYIEGLDIGDSGFEDLMKLIEWNNGALPTVTEMAGLLKRHLADRGIKIATHTSQSHTEIDITMPMVDKSVGIAPLIPIIADLKGISTEDVKAYSKGGGDSPGQNDAPLMDVFAVGVTNTDYYQEHGPIVLDYPDASTPLERTYRFVQSLHAY